MPRFHVEIDVYVDCYDAETAKRIGDSIVKEVKHRSVSATLIDCYVVDVTNDAREPLEVK